MSKTMLRTRGRKMKGDYAPLTDFVGVLLFAAVVVALILFVQTYLVKFNAEMKVSALQLQAVDAAHITKDCLSDSSGSIPSSLNNVDMCVDCKICSFDVGVRIDYLEGPKKNTPLLDTGYDDKKPNHAIFVTVTDSSKNYVSRLKVSLL